MPNVLSPRDLVSSPDKMNETVPHKLGTKEYFGKNEKDNIPTFKFGRHKIRKLVSNSCKRQMTS